jgi:uncharacterized protein
MVVFSASDYVIGAIAALVVGLSKTAIPGGGLLATPLLAMVFTGRLIPGGTLPILLMADLFAIRWYRDSVRWDVLRPLVVWVAAGFGAGAGFFIVLGKADRTLEVVIGIAILVVVALQVLRMIRRTPSAEPTTLAAAAFGISGGFTTFVSNNAGPIMNSYLVRLGLDKRHLVGTSAWFYFTVNVAKIPVYLALQQWSDGGPFFTRASLGFAAAMIPAVLVGVYGGKALFGRIPQHAFVIGVLVLSAGAAVKLTAGW